MKVLHIIQGFGPGGAETWLLSAVKYLHDHPGTGMQFDFVASGGMRSMYDAEIEQLGSKIFYIKYSLGRLISFRRQLTKILKENNYDVIHDHQDFVSGWHFFAASMYLPPMRIAHVHNTYNYVQNYTSSLFRKLSFHVGRMLMYKLATKITGTSNVVMDEYGYNKRPFISKRVNPIYCGLDIKDFTYIKDAKKELCFQNNWPMEDRIALFVGRLSTDTSTNEKNPGFAFEIAKSLVHDTGRQWRFLFVGYKGAFGDQLERKTKLLGLEEKIQFLGMRKDIPWLMSAADVLILPSFREALGMVAVEAQSTGLPVLMSNSVPTEAIINPLLVKRQSLDAPLTEWINDLKSIAETKIDRTTAVLFAAGSPFSIEMSLKSLRVQYSCT